MLSFNDEQQFLLDIRNEPIPAQMAMLKEQIAAGDGNYYNTTSLLKRYLATLDGVARTKVLRHKRSTITTHHKECNECGHPKMHKRGHRIPCHCEVTTLLACSKENAVAVELLFGTANYLEHGEDFGAATCG